MSHEILDIENLKSKLDKFANERDWKKFHSPKNISIALSVECSELLELFQWISEDDSWKIADGEKEKAVKDEIADIILYTVRLASLLKIDIPQAIEEKFLDNEKKYPPEKAWGSSKKYNEYD